METPSRVRILALALSDEKPSVRWNAAKSLAQMGPVAVSALTDLRIAMQSPEPGTALWARVAVAKITGDVSRHLPVLIAALTDKRHFPGMAPTAIGMLGPEAAPAVAALAVCLQDEHPDNRWAAALALSQIGPLAAEAVPALAHALSDLDEKVRWYAAIALGEIGPAAKGALHQLVRTLEGVDDDVRGSAAKALGRIGVSTSEVMEGLTELAGDVNPSVAEEARRSLVTLSGSGL